MPQPAAQFIIEPHLRFQGLAGEQWTMYVRAICSLDAVADASTHVRLARPAPVAACSPVRAHTARMPPRRFFKDPAGNNLEFKAMANPEYLFQKQ